MKSIRLFLTFLVSTPYLYAMEKAPIVISCFNPFPSDANETIALNYISDQVSKLTDDSIVFKQESFGKTVKKPQDIIPFLDEGTLNCAMTWPHFLKPDHNIRQLVTPTSGGGVGFNTHLHHSWFLYGGGKELTQRYWKEHERHTFESFPMMRYQEALGFTKEPISNFTTLDGIAFRTPGGFPAEIYKSIGVNAKPMGLKATLEAVKNNDLQGVEWCCPRPDRLLGLDKSFSNYYLQGAHQNISTVDIFISSNIWKKLSKQQQTAVKMAIESTFMHAQALAMKEHGEALAEMKKEGMTLHPTDQSYFDAYNAQVVQAQDALAKEDPFYKEILDSQRAYAEKINPYLSNCLEADLKIMRAAKNTNNIPNN